jgi:hypothetical protein
MQQGMTMKEIAALPIYLGDDDELNGMHCGWDISIVDADAKDDDNVYLVEMINERWGNIKLEKGQAILIS